MKVKLEDMKKFRSKEKVDMVIGDKGKLEWNQDQQLQPRLYTESVEYKIT